jgi:L-fucose mutarotase/ribose pyranase (RbsD/FucU family)
MLSTSLIFPILEADLLSALRTPHFNLGEKVALVNANMPAAFLP